MRVSLRPLSLILGLLLLCACDDGRDTSMVATPAAVTAPARERLMYVSVGGEAKLAVVTLGTDGMMQNQNALDTQLPGMPGAMTYARSTRRLYVGVSGDGGRVATLSLDSEGRPLLDGVSPGTGFPVFADVDHDGETLVTAYFGDDRLRSHDLSRGPPHSQRATVSTAEEPHQTLIGPTGDLVYVPHRNGQRIEWFTLGADGSLARRGGLAAEAGAGPRHLAFTPDGEYAYVINEYDDSISAHRVGADGTLTRFQTISTLPAGFDGDMNTGADIHVAPNGRFVYGSNRGHDSIAMFALESNGRLRSLGHVSTEAGPREFDVSPDGRFLVVAGRDSGFLQSYRVLRDGTLTSVDRLRVGNNLRWVVIE